jgi:cytochrome c biogenesis protein CcmG, thiol:disulfide interchange protein DsbE
VIRRAAQGLSLALVVALLGLLIWRVVHDDAGKELAKEIARGATPTAPDFRLRPIWAEAEGASPRLRAAVRRGEVTVADLRGRPTVLNVFASWCGPCKDEAPLFAQAARSYTGQVQFVALDFQDFDGDGRAFLRKHGNRFVALHDGNGQVAHRFGATGVPETYVLDARGRLIAHEPGAVSAADLARLIATVV